VVWSPRRLRELDLVALDQRVGEQLLAHPLDFGPGPCRVVRLDFEIDDPADTSLADREAELAQRGLDRLSLRIEDAVLRPNEDCGLHRSTTSGSAR
jgi:hypothetical protein